MAEMCWAPRFRPHPTNGMFDGVGGRVWRNRIFFVWPRPGLTHFVRGVKIERYGQSLLGERLPAKISVVTGCGAEYVLQGGKSGPEVWLVDLPTHMSPKCPRCAAVVAPDKPIPVLDPGSIEVLEELAEDPTNVTKVYY